MSKEVGRYVRPDQRQIVRLIELENGLFSFTVESQLWEDAHPAIGEGHWYWAAEEHGDGIYEDRDTALRELSARNLWMGELVGVQSLKHKPVEKPE